MYFYLLINDVIIKILTFMKGALIMSGDENSGSIQITNSDVHIAQHTDEREIETAENVAAEDKENHTDTVMDDPTPDDNSDNSYSQNPVIFYFKRLFTVALKTVKTPYFMLSAFVKAADYKVAFGFIIIQSFLFAGAIASIFDSVNDLINNLTSILSSSLYSSAAFSVAKSFFVTLISSILLMLIFASIIHIFVTLLMKTKATYKQMLCIASSKCIAQIPFTVVAFIVSMFSPVAALFIAGLGTLLGYFFVASALKGLDTTSENKVPYVAFLSFAVLAVITFAIIKIISPLFLSSSLLSLKRGLY